MESVYVVTECFVFAQFCHVTLSGSFGPNNDPSCFLHRPSVSQVLRLLYIYRWRSGSDFTRVITTLLFFLAPNLVSRIVGLLLGLKVEGVENGDSKFVANVETECIRYFLKEILNFKRAVVFTDRFSTIKTPPY